MKTSLQATISGSLSRLIPDEAKRYIVALSGGPDSVALLSLCKTWSSGSKNRAVPEALHVHHGIRKEEADRDARHCASICARLGIPLHFVTEDVEQKALSESMSLETAGREVRRSRFVTVSRARAAPVVLTGHHGDDQAETVLGNLLRGCGLRGLRGMEPISEIGTSGIKIGRPLLGTRRSEILKHLDEVGLESIEDSSNQLLTHRRNRLRLETFPALEREGPEIVSSLLNISHESRRRWEILQNRIDRCLDLAYIRPPRISLRLDCCKEFDGPEIADLLRSAILRSTGEEGGLIREHLGSLERLVTGEARSSSVSLPGDRKAIRCGGWIHIGPSSDPVEKDLLPFQICPETPTDSLGIRWHSSFGEVLTIRSLESGDKIPDRRGSIEELLRLQGVPADLRQRWPLAVDADGQIRWFVGFCRPSDNPSDGVSISATDPGSIDELCYHLLRITPQ